MGSMWTHFLKHNPGIALKEPTDTRNPTGATLHIFHRRFANFFRLVDIFIIVFLVLANTFVWWTL